MRKILSILLSIMLVWTMMPTATAFAGVSGTWDFDLDITENSAVKYNGQNTIKVGFGVQSDDLTLKTAQSVVFAFDTEIFDCIYNDNGTGTSAMDFFTPTLSTDDLSSMSYENYITGSGLTQIKWSSAFYVLQKDNLGYIVFQPTSTKSTPCSTKITLASLLLGFKEGKSKADVTDSSIRFANKEELKALNQNEAVLLSDGDQNNQQFGKTDGTDTLTNAEIVWGFDVAKAAYSGPQTIKPVVESKAGGNITLSPQTITGETVEYAYGTTADIPDKGWQDNAEFNNLAPGEYYFFARVKETADHQAGAAAISDKVTVYAKPTISYGSMENLKIGEPIKTLEPIVNVPAGVATSNPYSIISGTLPGGLSFDSSNGSISGTPTAADSEGTVTITVTDKEGVVSEPATVSWGDVEKISNTMDAIEQNDVEYNGSTSSVNPSATTNGTPATFQYKVKGADDSTYSDSKPTAVGEYTVRASSVGHATVKDRTITKDFKIVPKTLTNLDFTGIKVTKVYDGTIDAGTVNGTVKFDGKVGSEDVSVKAVAGAYADKTAGTGKSVDLKLSLEGEDKDNYKLETTTHRFATAEITKADYSDRTMVQQNVVKDDGSFIAPSFIGVDGEAVDGSITYTFDGAAKDYEEIKTALAAKPVSDGSTTYSIEYSFTPAAGSNYTGIKTGTITVKIISVAFTVGDAAATSDNAVTIKTAPTYGDTWEDIIKINDIVAKVGNAGDNETGKYSLDVTGTPDAGDNQTFNVLYNGTILGKTYTNVVVCSGTVNVAPKRLTANDLCYNGEITKVYDGTTSSSLSSVEVKDGVLVSTDTLTINGTAVYDSPDVSTASKVTFTPIAITTGNYTLDASETLDLSASITKATLDVEGIASAAASYGTMLKDIVISGLSAKLNGTDVDGNWSFKGNEILDAGNKEAYTATFVPTSGAGNYKELTAKVVPSISKAVYPAEITETKRVITNTAVQSVEVDLSSKISGITGASVSAAIEANDPDGIISNIVVDGNKVKFDVADISDVGKTAEINVTVSSTNYNDITAVLTIITTDKEDANVVVGSVPESKIYGDDDFTVTASVENKGEGDGVWSWESSDPTILQVSGNGNTATVKVLKASATGATITAKYESDTTIGHQSTTIIKVDKATIKIKANDISKYVGDTAPDLGEKDYTVTGLKAGDTFTTQPTIAYKSTPDMSKVGNVEIEVSGAVIDSNVAANYNDIQYVNGTLTISNKPSGGGGFLPTTAKPEITVPDGVTYKLSNDGTKVTFTVADGYELVDVSVNGVSKGKVDTLTGLKTGDKVIVKTQKKDGDNTALIEAVKNTKLVARTAMSKAKGKKAVKVYWYAKDGSELSFDGYEVYRSLKRYKGFGKKPFFKTANAKYYNTSIKKGTKYYYKVRAYKVIDGEKVYTDWSTKAWRTVK